MLRSSGLNLDQDFHLFELGAIALASTALTLLIGVIMMPSPPRDSRVESYLPQILPSSPPLLEKPDSELFAGGFESLVSRSVGHAEGTRNADGSKTSAWEGHRDPGNAVWNRGTFSYQHSASSPEDADRKQLTRLQRQFVQISEDAMRKGLVLTLVEKLNAIDLANQAPLAAMGEGAFVDRLKECRRDLICARSRSYLDPRTGRLDAPGLGNNMFRVEEDQRRRAAAIDEVLNRRNKEIRQ